MAQRRGAPLRPRDLERWLLTAALLSGLTGGLLGFHGLAALADRDPVFLGSTTWRLLELATLRFPVQLADGLPTSLAAARALLPGACLLLLAYVVTRASRTPLTRAAARFARDHVVVCGPGAEVAGVVEGLRDAGHPVLLLQPGPRELRGVVAVRGHPCDRRSLLAASVPHARAVIVPGDDDAQNLDIGLAVKELCSREAPDREAPPICNVRIEADVMRENAARWLQSGDSAGAEFRLFSATRHAARLLLQHHPLARSADVRGGQRPNLLIHGTTSLAEQILLEILHNGHHGVGAPRVTLVAEAALDYERRFLDRFPAAGQVSELSFHDLDAATPRASCAEVLAGLGPEALTGIYLVEGTLAQNLRLAGVLRDLLRETCASVPPMYVHVMESSSLAGNLGGAEWEAGLPQLVGFGSERELFSPAQLLDDALDALARAHHESYLEECRRQGRSSDTLASARPWTRLPEAFRDATRRQADHVEVKLRTLGWAAHEAGGAAAGLFEPSPAEIESSAEIEHERWMAQRLLEGWSFAPVRDDRLKRHPGLVAYAELSEPVKEFDRIAVRELPRHLQRTGRVVRRDLGVGIVATGGSDALDERFDARADEILERLQEENPQRGLVLLSALVEPAARRFAKRALATGAFRLCVPWPLPTDPYLALLGEGAPEFRELVTRADQSFAMPISRGERAALSEGKPPDASWARLARFVADRSDRLVVLEGTPAAGPSGMALEAWSLRDKPAPTRLTRRADTGAWTIATGSKAPAGS